MKRRILPVLLFLFLTGCSSNNDPTEKILSIRSNVMGSEEISFDAVITADYTEEIYVFGMQCVANDQGDIVFKVTSPEAISGLTGNILDDQGYLTFDDEVVAFQTLADGRISPVCAPWLFMKTLRSGYIKACSNEPGKMIALIDDSYYDHALQLEITFDESGNPCLAEIIWDQYRFITIEISNFTCV